MNVRKVLNDGFALLEAERFADAERLFYETFHNRSLQTADRYCALKGLTRALDGLGRWHLSETVFANGFRHLQEQAQANRTTRNWLWTAAAGFVAFAVLSR